MAKLDLTVWRPFLDRRPGKLIGFGQCATGNDWTDKLTHLQPDAFCSMWMLDYPAVAPIRLFFVPFRIEQRRWLDVARQGGIVFDRCRIANHADGIHKDLRRELSQWTIHVLRKQVRL